MGADHKAALAAAEDAVSAVSSSTMMDAIGKMDAVGKIARRTAVCCKPVTGVANNFVFISGRAEMERSVVHRRSQ